MTNNFNILFKSDNLQIEIFKYYEFINCYFKHVDEHI